MTSVLARWGANAAAIAVAAWLFSGIAIGGKNADFWPQLFTLLLVAAIFTIINMYVAPVIKLLSLPFIIVTLGLMLIVINALLLLLTEWITQIFPVTFHVDGFWVAFWGSIVISLVNGAINLLVDTK